MGGHSETATSSNPLTPVPKPVEVRLEEFRAWVRMQPCLGCGRVPTSEQPGQPAHIHTWGASRTDEANLLPLCVDCHAIQHTIGILTWARSLGLAGAWDELEKLGIFYWLLFTCGEPFL